MNNFLVKTLKYSNNFLKKVKVNNKTKKITKKKESGFWGYAARVTVILGILRFFVELAILKKLNNDTKL